ncbi:MAG: ribonuclease HI [Archangiaceae bacterium]|nr:ribonuclease HI [Archangiaceae bacterium]
MSGTWFVYTDGSAKAGDGAPGGWGFHARAPDGGAPLEGWGQARDTLAKCMEYRAVAEALAALPAGATATVLSDNQSLIENFSKQLGTWRARGFARVDESIVEHVKRADAAMTEKQLSVGWQWLKAHNGNPGNERADALAAQGAREAKKALEAERKLKAATTSRR